MYLIQKIFFCFSIAYSIIYSDAVIDMIDEDYFGQDADRYNWSGHPCNRDCSPNANPKICYYVMVIEQYSSMSKACYDCPYNVTDCDRPHCIAMDGVQKMLYTANRQLPGPSIQVCKNDRIIVDVRNTMLAESTSIHWHGVKQQGTPYMDGVPFVSQCPINPGDTFRYSFTASDSGTFFWHSHTGGQRTDGLYGCLIVRESRDENLHRDLYDFDTHHMVISDWLHSDANSALVKNYHYRQGGNPDTLIVNGKGRFQSFTKNGRTIYTPTEIFEVKQGHRYRFRLVNGGADDCPTRVSFDQHTITVLSLDAKDIHPVVVDAIDIWPGERVDFVINANQKPDTYWIRLHGFGICTLYNSTTNSTEGAYQVARLYYKTTMLRDPSSPIGYNVPQFNNRTRVLNPFQKGTEAPPFTNIAVPSLTSMDANDASLAAVPDKQIYISFSFNRVDNYDFHRKGLYGINQLPGYLRMGSFQLNHISLKLQSFPLMSQWYMLDQNTFCNSTSIPEAQCTQEYCACTHVIQVKLGSVAELVLVAEGDRGISNHPFHLHGHFFRVVATEKLQGPTTVERVQQLDRQGKIKRRLDRAPIKDTIKAPGGGYTIIRFYANNPGYWLFHCHFEQHANVGMALIFKVGEHHEFPPIPPNFPTCGNYMSHIM